MHPVIRNSGNRPRTTLPRPGRHPFGKVSDDRETARCRAGAMLYYGAGRESGGTVDAVDSKSTALRAWGFESPLSHHFDLGHPGSRA
jgi:hypothetical protein